MNEQALKDRLANIAKAEERTFNEIWHQLAIERFLVRLSRSKYSEKFIFKGGLLLSHYLEIGRETKDIDFLATQLDAASKNIKESVRDICDVKVDDNFNFSFSRISKLEQPHMQYPGFRIILTLTFANKMKDHIQLDIGTGDIVAPNKKSLPLFSYKGKPIFEGSISIQVYPVESIFAEKLETLISKGAINSRMKDYHDLLLICREKNLLSIPKLKKSIAATFKNRGTSLTVPVYFSEEDYSVLQRYWDGHLR